MKSVFVFLYLLFLSLWTGGMAIFTFIVTPAIFRSYGRDQAGEIVGRLFPGYFLYLLVLSALALFLFFLLGADQPGRSFRASLFLLVVAAVINAYVLFSLHPRTVQVKQQVASFEAAAPDSPARQEFQKLHALSAVLNLVLLADGIALLALSRNLVTK
jgi:phosphatidylglycerophosphate synthase